MKTNHKRPLMCLLTTLFLVFSGISLAQEFEPFDQIEEPSAGLASEYPSWSVGVGAGVEFPWDDLIHHDTWAHAIQVDGRVRASKIFHIRGLFRRQTLKAHYTMCRGVPGVDCFGQYDRILNQYHLLLGWHTAVGQSENSWVNIELGPALIDWGKNGGSQRDSNAALSLGLNYLLAISERLSLDLGLNATSSMESKHTVDFGETMLGLNIGLNFH